MCLLCQGKTSELPTASQSRGEGGMQQSPILWVLTLWRDFQLDVGGLGSSLRSATAPGMCHICSMLSGAVLICPGARSSYLCLFAQGLAPGRASRGCVWQAHLADRKLPNKPRESADAAIGADKHFPFPSSICYCSQTPGEAAARPQGL